jgi:SOS response regulatory protein OraA/RecX
MLAGRELSEAQVRQRLIRRGHDAADIDTAIERLKSNGTIDDARAAAVIARRETTVRRRGKSRVTSRIPRGRHRIQRRRPRRSAGLSGSRR